eukprot:Gb_29347 [translate_table: standard]
MKFSQCPPPTSVKHANHILVKRVIVPVEKSKSYLLYRRTGSNKSLAVRLGEHPKISYQELVNATGGLVEANFIGGGCFGSVYKGILSDGTIVAVKVLHLQKEEAHKSISTECKVLGRVRRRNLVSVGIVLLEMLTRKRPTDEMFVEGLNLHKWVSMAYPDRIDFYVIHINQYINVKSTAVLLSSL